MSTPIDRDEVQRLVNEQGAQLVDVLPGREFEEEHLPGSINIPLRVLDSQAEAQLQRDKPVVVY